MPYKQITQLPDNMKDNVPKHAQEIYKEAFDSAEDQYGGHHGYQKAGR
jgi:cation transport regulator